MFVFRSSFADWYNVPSGSMNPTIVEGDRILVNRMAYRLDLPFTDIPLLRTAAVARGDVVVFTSEKADQRLVKRVVGLPGDSIAMRDNRLFINDIMADYQQTSAIELTEQLGEISHQIVLHNRVGASSSFGPVRVPEGHYLVLGDNRNNSADSRVYGFIPDHEIQGRAINVVLSLDPENYYLPRSERYLMPLQNVSG